MTPEGFQTLSSGSQNKSERYSARRLGDLQYLRRTLQPGEQIGAYELKIKCDVNCQCPEGLVPPTWTNYNVTGGAIVPFIFRPKVAGSKEAQCQDSAIQTSAQTSAQERATEEAKKSLSVLCRNDCVTVPANCVTSTQRCLDEVPTRPYN